MYQTAMDSTSMKIIMLSFGFGCAGERCCFIFIASQEAVGAADLWWVLCKCLYFLVCPALY